MICPYICNIDQTVQVTYDYDSENINTAYQQKLLERKIPLRCEEDNCAAWRDGRCCYGVPTDE